MLPSLNSSEWTLQSRNAGAHAMETGADLVSANGHYEHVDGIAWVRLRAERGAGPATAMIYSQIVIRS